MCLHNQGPPVGRGALPRGKTAEVMVLTTNPHLAQSLGQYSYDYTSTPSVSSWYSTARNLPWTFLTNGSARAWSASLFWSLDHPQLDTHTHTRARARGRTPLYEWSARTHRPLPAQNTKHTIEECTCLQRYSNPLTQQSRDWRLTP